MKKAVFLDRDGTLNVDVGYLHQLEDLELFPWTGDALRLLQRAGYALIVVTNQSGIARGMIKPGFVEICHAEMRRRLQSAGTDLDGLYYCQHHPGGSVPELSVECRCRKPAPGMVEEAVRDHGIDAARSWVIGDKWRAARGAARRCGVRQPHSRGVRHPRHRLVHRSAKREGG
jgi:D,D-heptose 1,7-bisphosphate phosphatase